MLGDDDDDNTENDWEEKSDLTRIEDLSEFLHEDDPDVDSLFESAPSDGGPSDEPSEGEDLSVGLDDLDDGDFDEDPPSFPSSDGLSHDDDDDSDDFSNSSEFDGATEPDIEMPPPPMDDEGDSDDEGSSFFDSDDNDEDSDSFDSSFDSGDDFGAVEEDSFASFDSDEDESEDTDAFGTSEDDNAFGSDFSDNSLEDEEEDEEGNEDDQENEDNNEDNNEDDDSFPSFDQGEEESESPLSFDEPGAASYQSEETRPAEREPMSSPDRENFQDLRDFGNSISYGLVKSGGNPPFTLILKNIKYEEDAEDIMILLREHGLVNDENESTTEQGLQSGHLLISQISEYSAIYLAHKLRRFDVDIRIGLSDQLHPSKSYEHDNRGLVSKYNLKQDRTEFVEMDHPVVEVEDIIVATTSQLESYDIIRYIEVVTAHHFISETELKGQTPEVERTENSGQESFEEYQVQHLGLEEVYQELSKDLRNQAYKFQANAVVGLNYTLTPVVSSQAEEVHYKVTCTGNAVWVSDRNPK